MTTPAFPNSFVSANTIFATAINSNYTTWLSILVDGTYTFSIGNLTANSINVSGNVVIGSGVSQFVNFNGAFNTHLVASESDLGVSSYPFGDVYVDFGTSHAGTVYFNAGTSQYMQVTSGGTTNNWGGFTTVNFGSGTVSGVSLLATTDITAGTDINISGLVLGQRTAYYLNTVQQYFGNTSFVGYPTPTLNAGFKVIRSGSVAGINFFIMNEDSSPASSFTGIIDLYKNNTLFYTMTTINLSAFSDTNTYIVSFARNSFTVSGGDVLGIGMKSFSTGAYVVIDSCVELYEDS